IVFKSQKDCFADNSSFSFHNKNNTDYFLKPSRLGRKFFKILLLMMMIFGVQDVFSQPCDCNTPGVKTVGSAVGVPNLTDAFGAGILNPGSTSSQPVCIKGTFNINANYVFDDADLTLDANATVNVLSSFTLIIKNQSTLMGCTSMWNALIVHSQAHLKITNSTIQDGQTAIQANFGSSIIVQDNDFINNYIGIRVGGKIPANMIGLVYQPDIMEGNDFETLNSGLKSPFDGQIGLTGVYLSDVYGFTIGTTNTSAVPNTFTRFHIGVLVHRSTINVHHAEFSRIANYANFPSTIPGDGGSSISSKNGYGDFITHCKFESGHTGISSEAFWLSEIEHNFMPDLTGVSNSSSMNNGIRAANTDFGRLYIRENDIATREEAVLLRLVKENSEIRIKNNVNITGLPYANFKREAIDLIGCHVPPGKGSISLNSNINTIDTETAVLLSSCSNIHVQQNDIDLEGAPQGNDPMKGIVIEGSSDLYIANNNINGALATGSTTGMISEGSVDITQFCCNRIDTTDIGVQFDGTNMLTFLNGTRLNDHDIGLLYEQNAMVNAQIDAGNRWTGTYNIVGARHEGFNPTTIQDSRYEVRFQGEELPSYDTPNAPGTQWFFPSFNLPYSCLTECPVIAEDFPPDQLVLSVADGTLSVGTVYENTLIWQAERAVFRKIERTPSWAADSSLSAFYTAKQGTTVDLFNDIEERITALRDVRPTETQAIENNLTAVQSRLRQITVKDSLLWGANPTDSTALVQDIQNLQTEIMNYSISNDSLYEMVTADRSALIQGIIADNNNIITSAIYEQNEQIVNDIWLNTVGQNNYSLTQNQLNSLESVVWQCPLMGGKAVYRARALYLMEIDTVFNDNLLCSPPQSMIGNNQNGLTTGTYLFPNPAQQSVTLKLEETFNTESELVIMDLNGKVINKYIITPDESQFRFSVENLPDGFY
ncbi:MAG: T9SS C-terminal target domain-containing protein, partial [Bacteroidetes bacterium]